MAKPIFIITLALGQAPIAEEERKAMEAEYQVQFPDYNVFVCTDKSGKLEQHDFKVLNGDDHHPGLVQEWMSKAKRWDILEDAISEYYEGTDEATGATIPAKKQRDLGDIGLAAATAFKFL